MATNPPASGGADGAPRPREDEWEEVSLTDIVLTVHRWKAVLVTILLVSLLGSVALTALAEPVYSAQASIVPVEQRDIIRNWLESRRSAEVVVEDLGPAIYPVIAPGQWDRDAEQWRGTPPGLQNLGARLASHVTIGGQTGGGDRLLTITVEMSDPVAARDVASGYLRGLDTHLRPHLENLTRQEKFDRYYDGKNAQEAQHRAEVTAQQKEYWIVLDTPLAPKEPVKPNPKLNIALGAVLGTMLGFLSVFAAEWVSNFRAELKDRAAARRR